MSIITGCQCTAEELEVIEDIATMIAADEVFGTQSFEHKCSLIIPRLFMTFIKFMNAPGQSLSFEQLNQAYAMLAKNAMMAYFIENDGAKIELIPPRFGLTRVFNSPGSAGKDSKISAFLSCYENNLKALLQKHSTRVQTGLGTYDLELRCAP